MPLANPWDLYVEHFWPRYTGATLSRCEQGEAIRKVIDSGYGVALHGPLGTGKTYALVATFKHLAEAGVDALLMAQYELVQYLHDSIADNPGRSPQFAREMVERAMTCEALLLDDLDKDGATAWTERRLYALFDTRSRGKLLTCITANYWGDALAARIGGHVQAEALADRLTEMCVPLGFTGASRRSLA